MVTCSTAVYISNYFPELELFFKVEDFRNELHLGRKGKTFVHHHENDVFFEMYFIASLAPTLM